MMINITSLRIAVNVTEDDIYQGVKNNCTQCPVARAINRAIKDLATPFEFFTEIEDGYVTVIDPKRMEAFRGPMNRAIGDFVDNFDNDDKVDSFITEIELKRME